MFILNILFNHHNLPRENIERTNREKRVQFTMPLSLKKIVKTMGVIFFPNIINKKLINQDTKSQCDKFIDFKLSYKSGLNPNWLNSEHNPIHFNYV